MPRYISGRSKKTPQSGLTSDRYRYLSVGDAEPNLGDTPDILGDPNLPAGQQYIVVSFIDRPGERFWIPNQGGIIPGTISVFKEDVLVGGLSSTTQLNFIGQAITAEGVGGPNPGVAVTITVAPPGNPNEVLFVSAGSTDFATDTRFIFDDGLLKTGDRITVGTGGTVITTTGIGSVGIGTTQPTENLHLEGDFRITGTIYDSNNQPGSTGELISKTATGGLIWVTPSSVNSGAGGTIGQIQFHNTAGLVDGADNFYFDFNNNRVGIGSTQPTQLLDVLGISTFSGGVFVDNLSVSGFSTFTEIIDANGGLDVFGHTELDSVNVSGLSTFGGNVDINVDLDVDGTTDLDILNVAETASFTATADNTLGNTNTGAVRIDGGVGIDKNLTVGQGIQATNLNITGVGTIAQFDFGVGQFDHITVLGVSTLGNVVVEGNSIKTKSGTGNLTLDSDGSSSIIVNDFLFVNKNTESVSKDTGSIITEGGIGVEKSVFIGLNLDVDGNTELDGLNVDGSTDLDTLNVSIASTTASLTLSNTGIAVTAILDEDDMVSDRDDALATQQSIKSYIDSQVTAQDLDFAGDSGTGNVDLDSQTFTIAGTTNEIETFGSGQTLTIGLPNDVTIGNTLTVTGTATLNGNVDLGNANSDLISIIGDVDTNILPSTNGTLDLGAAGSTWDNVYANTFVGAITGNADTATALDTARNFSISGDGSAPNVSFDGTADVDLELTLDTVNTDVGTFGDSITVPQVTVNGKGLVTGVNDVAINFGAANVATADSLSNSRNIAATGDIAWNVDFKGHEDVTGVSTLKDVGPGAGTYGGEDTKVLSLSIDDKGRVTGISSVDIEFSDANVATADSLTDSRNIAATGDITWNVDFKGHEDVTGVSTLKDVGPGAGVYGGENTKVLSLSLDDKGRITGVSSVSINFGAATVATADSLTDSRNIAATGDIAWDVDFKGHENVTATATLATVNSNVGTFGNATTVPQVTVNGKGLVTGVTDVAINFGQATVATANSLTNSRNIAATGDITWDVDFKGDEDVTAAATLATVFTAGTYGGENTKVLQITADEKGRITGISSVSIDFGTASVATADSLTDSRNIAATGDIAWDVDFKGHENVTSTATLATVNSDVGTFGDATTVPQVTVNAKGLVTGVTDVPITFSDANVATASSLAISRNIAATGDIAWDVDFKGDQDVTGVSTLASIITPGTVGSSTQVGVVTFDAKGRITEASNVDINFSGSTVGTANDLAGGAAGSIPYQDGPGSTVFLAEPDADDRVLTYNNTTDAPEWKQLSLIPGGGTTLTIKEENSPVGDIDGIDEINFVGDQITATGSGSTATITVSDVVVDQTDYTGSNPISVTSGNQVGIASTSNAYGRRYVQDTEPTGASPGDIWYDTAGSAGIDAIAIPVGGIIMWTGTSLPSSNWALCDGNNGTPDLRNRFIMAAHSISKTGTTSQAGPGFSTTTGALDESGQYEPGDIGGEAAHQLTEDEMPSHVHTGQEGQNIRGSDDGGIRYTLNVNDVAMNAAGGDEYHENRPPYYALAFIMRIS